MENIKERPKLIAAIFLCIALAIAGLGTALAAPDCTHENASYDFSSGEYTGCHKDTDNPHLQYVRDHNDYAKTDWTVLSRSNAQIYFDIICDDCGQVIDGTVEAGTWDNTDNAYYRLKEITQQGNCTNGGATKYLGEYAYGTWDSDLNQYTYTTIEQREMTKTNWADSQHQYDKDNPVAEEAVPGTFGEYYNGSIVFTDPYTKYTYKCKNCDATQTSRISDNPTTTIDSFEMIWNDGNKDYWKMVVTVDPTGTDTAEFVDIDTKDVNDDKSQHTCTIKVTEKDGSVYTTQSPVLMGDTYQAQIDAGYDGVFEEYDLSTLPDPALGGMIATPLYYPKEPGYPVAYTSWMNVITVNDVVYTSPTITTQEQLDAFVEDIKNNAGEDPTPDDPGVSATFKLTFKATGIQATSFNDYKEAMAALNAGN